MSLPLTPHSFAAAPRRPLKLRRLSGLLALGALLASPAQALERFVVDLPYLETSITIDLGEVESAEALLYGNSDLAELARAGGGSLQRKLLNLFQAQLPGELQAIDPAVGDPLLRQVLAGISHLIDLESGAIDTSGQALARAIHRARQAGQPTLLGLLRQLPGTTATVDFSRVLFFASRLRRNQAEGQRLAAEAPEQPVDPTAQSQGPFAVRSGEFQLAVDHRPEPMRVLWLRPQSVPREATVVISHGLWDSPKSFLGWARYLASHGHAVLLPVHQGSDTRQQSGMVAGVLPPPSAAELHRRPLDVSALLDGLEKQSIAGLGGIMLRDVGVVGHSWGAITALQIGGLRPERRTHGARCEDQRDPERNLSWALQCSLLEGGTAPLLHDPRVGTVVAVSPPSRLLFDPGSGPSLRVPALLVSGTSDWVVPSGPEAITPFTLAGARAKGHRLVLARAGDHFNLRAPDPASQGVLGRLIREWLQSRLRPSREGAAPPAGSPGFQRGAWGDAKIPLVDVTERVDQGP